MSAPEVRPCARCGEREVYGSAGDLTCCDRCASDIGYHCAISDAVALIEREADYLTSVGTVHAMGKVRVLMRVSNMVAAKDPERSAT